MKNRLPLYSLIAAGLLSACSSSGGNQGVPSPDEKSELEQAKILKQRGDLNGAAEYYRKIAATYPKSVDASLELAAIDRKLGHPDEAVAVMKEALDRQADNPAVLTQLGYALIDAGHYEQAVQIFDELIVMNPQDAVAYTGKGVAFDHSGNHLAAQELYKQALHISPESLSARNNMGMSLILNGQLEPAIALLETLRLEAPNNKIVLHNLALAYGLKGDNKRALALNLKDLSPEEAKENLRFYAAYAKSHNRKKFEDAAAKLQIGFAEATPEETTATTPKAIAAKTHKAPLAKKPKKIESETQVSPAAPKSAPDQKTSATSEPMSSHETPEITLDDVKLPESGLGHTELPTSSDKNASQSFPSQHQRR